MKLPYGLMNFKVLIEGNYLYIDKTRYIEALEETGFKYPFFIRPRRFGKSLFLSMLKYYYDEIYANEFDSLFKNLYINRHPTPQKSSRLVLSLDFSGLNTETKTTFKESFRRVLINKVSSFFYEHESCFPALSVEDFILELKKETDIRSIIDSVILQTERTGKKLFILIDEYDHFANDILAMGESSFYKELIQARGLVRDFYEALKDGTKTVIEYIFITGISPVMLDDLTSGYNISANLTTDFRFNEMLGFTEEEVAFVLKTAGLAGKVTVDKLRPYYNGYTFSSNSKVRVYNPDMVLYFATEWAALKGPPEYLIDENVKTDYGRLKRLMIFPKNKDVLQKIIETESCQFTLAGRFSFDRMYDHKYFESLLFYLGLLTFQKREQGISTYTIPNYVIKKLFWEYFREEMAAEYDLELDSTDIQRAIRDLANKGDLSPFLGYLKEKVLPVLSRRDLIRFDEKYIKVMILSLLVLSPLYRLESEQEVRGGYTDLFLARDIRFPDLPWEWLWELKYIKESERSSIEEVKAEGLAQLKRYSQDARFQNRKDLRKALLVFVGRSDCMFFEL